MADDNKAHTAISFHEAAVAAIEAQKERLVRQVTLLQSKRAYHLSAIRYYKGLITLARRLPPEVLTYIFQICIDLGYPRTPLNVSGVCSEWRKAALAPTLWSNIVVDPDSDERSLQRRIKFRLDRSGLAPLSISLSLSRSAVFMNVLAMLMQHTHRWSSLYLTAESSQEVDHFLGIFGRASFPLLSNIGLRLSFTGGEVPLGVDLQEPPLAFGDAPRLNRLSFHAIIPQSGLFYESLSLLKITSLILATTPRHQDVELLRLFTCLPLLQTLILKSKISIVDGDIGTIAEPVHLSWLRKLDITGEIEMLNLLPFIQTETLSHLHLRAVVPVSEEEQVQGSLADCLHSFIATQGHALEYFELHGFYLSAVHMSSYFTHLPNLVELQLHDSDISDEAIRLFSGPDACCPKLSKLDFRWCGQVTGKAMVSMVQNRLRGSHNLHSINEVTLIHCSFVQEADVLDLAALTICRLLGKPDDYCRGSTCCQNERYRQRLQLRQMFGVGGRVRKLTKNLIL
ncbi:hypothetical protein BDN71DRAFT_1443272 [Pleurotus eryngii]|uniref:F-box domain-containing protein n=1 Tax=Pleurotus eryngii TaxID=5323 RepID=A0A9P6D9R8_PLEER|nr:hypothetical protein BDN71DRAFT_1443272 [Pleurotus eryngii]